MNCSRSGYYDWITLGRPKYKSYNETLNNEIVGLYHKDPRWGIEQIQMKLKKIHGTFTTKATVYRYMKLNHIQSITRKKRKKYNKVEHRHIPNLLRRDFTTERPNQKWSIDVSFLPTIEGTIYLCAIKDLYDKSIISYIVSLKNDLKLILDTVKGATRKIPRKQRNRLILHSDQGGSFTSRTYSKWLKRFGMRHSISARGSCVDNCPIESWFSAFKSESMHLHHKTSIYEMIILVDEYVKYYNEERQIKKIKELTPYEYRQLALSSHYL